MHILIEKVLCSNLLLLQPKVCYQELLAMLFYNLGRSVPEAKSHQVGLTYYSDLCIG